MLVSMLNVCSQVVIHNMGRKQQVLAWNSERLDEVRRQYNKVARVAGVSSLC